MKDGPRQFTELEKQTGMLEEHLLVIAKLSLANDIVIAFRPVNESVKQRFEEGCVGKGMDIKGKSADQGIALNGLIPVDAEFSKLGTTDSYDAIKKYNGYNSEKIAKDQGRYETIQKTDVSQLKDKELINFEDSLKNLATTVPLLDDKNRQVYGFKDKDGHALKDNDNKMIFATKDKDGFHVEGTGTAFVPPADCKESAIEVLSYRNLKVENNKLVEKEPTAITADYDQLFAATIEKDIATPRGIPGQEYAGIATPTNHAITTALAADTKNKLAISHAPETGNPCPEDLSDANYVVFVPSDKLKRQFETAKDNGEKQDVTGCIKILKNEKEIIDFYNEKEKDGYSIPVNDMWGWQRNNNGKLEVNPDRLSAQTLDLEIKKYEGKGDAETDAKALKSQYKELGKLKLEEPGGDRNERIGQQQAEFNGLENAFAKKHGAIAPTQKAREDAQTCAGAQQTPEKELETTITKSAPQATLPSQGANPAKKENNKLDKPKSGVYNTAQPAQSGFSLNRGLSLDLAKIKEASKGFGIKADSNDVTAGERLPSPQTTRATAQSPTISQKHI